MDPQGSPIDILPDPRRDLLGGRRIGCHVSIGDGLLRAAERARSLGVSAIQVFADDPKAWIPRGAPHPDSDRFKALLEAWDIQLVVHGSYLVNLASPDAQIHARSVERMRHELASGAALGARLVNVHVGSHRGAGVDRGGQRAADAIARILDGEDQRPGIGPRLVLEVAAGQGDSLGTTVEELAAILDAAQLLGVDRARSGVCLDTAHLWSSGYALDEPSAIDALLARVDGTMGPDALTMVHLNDSRAARGSRQDRHEHLGDGRIGESGLGHVVRHPRLARVPMILETPDLDDGWDALDMQRVRTLLVGGSLADPGVVPVRDAGGARTHTPESPPDAA
jgi:deoxyribonuclease-4